EDKTRPESQETLAEPRSTFPISRTETRYDRVPDRSGSRSGSPILAFRSTTVNDCVVMIFRWTSLKERKGNDG
ncbi:hypothetical protein Tco_0329628, partial [Tanacetum coccineum]